MKHKNVLKSGKIVYIPIGNFTVIKAGVQETYNVYIHACIDTKINNTQYKKLVNVSEKYKFCSMKLLLPHMCISSNTKHVMVNIEYSSIWQTYIPNDNIVYSYDRYLPIKYRDKFDIDERVALVNFVKENSNAIITAWNSIPNTNILKELTEYDIIPESFKWIYTDFGKYKYEYVFMKKIIYNEEMYKVYEVRIDCDYIKNKNLNIYETFIYISKESVDNTGFYISLRTGKSVELNHRSQFLCDEDYERHSIERKYIKPNYELINFIKNECFQNKEEYYDYLESTYSNICNSYNYEDFIQPVKQS